MALGENLFNGIPNIIWIFVHAIAALVGIYFLITLHLDKKITWALILYAVSASLFVLVFFDIIDLLAVHVISTVFLLVAFILVGKHAHICCR